MEKTKMHFSTWSPSYPCKTGHYWHKTDNSMPEQLVGDILRENFQIETSLVHRVLDKWEKMFEMNVLVDFLTVQFMQRTTVQWQCSLSLKVVFGNRPVSILQSTSWSKVTVDAFMTIHFLITYTPYILLF